MSTIFNRWLSYSLENGDEHVKAQILSMVVQVIKFNFATIPLEARTITINTLCSISNLAKSINIVALCLQCFDEIVIFLPHLFSPFQASLFANRFVSERFVIYFYFLG